MLKRVLYLVLALVVLLLLVAGGARWWVGQSFPQTSGTLELEGLDGPVEVRRDEFGVPHIYATSIHDAYFAQGVVHAQDRLWQMDFQRRVGLGRLSELLGEATVETDRFLRTVGTHRAAQQDWEAMSNDEQAVMEAYAAGVNAFLATSPRLPLEYTILGVDVEPWEPMHSLAWGKMLQWDLNGNWTEELLRPRLTAQLGPETTSLILQDGVEVGANLVPSVIASHGAPQIPPLLQGGPMFGRGSNAWVVSGTLTASGRPILENDPHMAPNMPSQWYLVGLHAPGLDVIGGSLPGVPAVIVGHNADVAWGVTNLSLDVQDLYIERLDASGDAYEYQGEMIPLDRRTEMIQVKDAEAVELVVNETRHGPLLNDVVEGLSEPLAFQWLATQQPTTLFRAVLGMQQASSVAESLEVLRAWDLPGQNIVIADRQGQIAYQAAGLLPIRSAAGGVLPQPGWTGEWEWQGTVPYEEMPRIVDPEAGYLVTANENSFPGDYPYYTGSGWAAPFRKQRISAMIEAASGGITLTDMRDIQADVTSLPAQQLVPYWLAVSSDDQIVQRAQEQLAQWNRELAPDLPGAGIYEVLYGFTVRQLLSDDFDERRPAAEAFGVAQEINPETEATLLEEYLGYYQDHALLLIELMEQPDHPLWDDTRTPAPETRDDILLRAWGDTTDWLGRQYGDVPHEWFWKRLHPITFNHPLGSVAALAPIFNRTVEVGGDRSVPNAIGFGYGESFEANNAPSVRHLADVGGWENSLTLHTTGQSGQPFHPHYDDMIARWKAVDLIPMLWSESQTAGASQGRVLILQPSAP